MRASIRLGRVAGIPLGLNWSAVVVVALFAYLLSAGVLPSAVPRLPAVTAWAVGTATALAFFVTLLAHEVAHAVVARRCGIEVRSVTLWMLGGVTELGGAPQRPGQALAVSVSGPAVSLVAGAVLSSGAALALGLGGPRLLVAVLAWLGGTNLLLGVFNLLPAAPLDGGRVLAALVWWRTGDRTRAETTAALAGRLLGQVFIGLGVVELLVGQVVSGLWLALMGWFLVTAATAEGRSARSRHALAGFTVADAMTRDPLLLPGYLQVDRALARALPVLVYTRQDLCGVVDLDGHPLGLVSIDALAGVPADDRAGRRVAELTVPLDRLEPAWPEQPLTAVADRLVTGLPVPVVDAGRLVGVLTRDDLRWALRRSALAPDEPGSTLLPAARPEPPQRPAEPPQRPAEPPPRRPEPPPRTPHAPASR